MYNILNTWRQVRKTGCVRFGCCFPGILWQILSPRGGKNVYFVASNSNFPQLVHVFMYKTSWISYQLPRFPFSYQRLPARSFSHIPDFCHSCYSLSMWYTKQQHAVQKLHHLSCWMTQDSPFNFHKFIMHNK